MDGRAASQTITDRLPYFQGRGVQLVVLSAPTGRKDDRFAHYQTFSAAPSGLLFELRHIISQRFASRAVQKLLKALLTLVLLPLYLIEVILIHLDSQWSWFISAAFKGRRIIKKHKPEVIYTTAGPPSTHLAGMILSRMCGLPWLAEIHDPLIYDDEPKKNRFHYFKKWLEKKIFQHADEIIYFTDQALARARRRNNSSKGLVLRPGAEPPGMEPVPYEKRGQIHFGHFGSLAENRNLRPVFQAVGEIVSENMDLRDTIRIDIYGAALDPVSNRSMEEFGISDIVLRHGRLEYDPQTGKTGRQRVLAEMRKSDVLLLIHGESVICDEYIPSKLYEYLLTARPIIGLASSGSELDMFLRENLCDSIDINDFSELKYKIYQYIDLWNKDGVVGRNLKSPFTVSKTSDDIVDIVNSI